ncbi:MAG: ATP-binding cassette domain-containing protein [bacterium]|nr:ATP-binding cassette domain-containing protein [bacterium]
MITLKNIHKSFNDKVVLQGLDLQVNAGESFVIMGGSGCGKSVMLKCILGLLTPDQGSILIEGQELTTASEKTYHEILNSIGMLFQGGALFDSLSVWENVAFRPLQSKKLSKSQARDLALENLEHVGLSERILDLSPAELSGGMKKRVALARAIAYQPKILFFDEPTTGLDPITSARIDDLIVRSVKTLGATAITITHNVASMRRIADHVGLIHQGNFVWKGSLKDLETCKDPHVKQFVEGLPDGPMTENSHG